MSMKKPWSRNLGLRTGIAAQVIIKRNNQDNPVMAAKKVTAPIAAKTKAAIPKTNTELAGVKNLLLTSPNQAGRDFSKAKA